MSDSENPSRPFRGGYPVGSNLRGLARATYQNPPGDNGCSTSYGEVMDPDSPPPPTPTWRRWKAAHRRPDPTIHITEAMRAKTGTNAKEPHGGK